jgi:uncharacterized protein involved in outer membrane biogenesis
MDGGGRKLGSWHPPRWVVVAVVVLLLLTGLALAFDSDWLKRPIERRVSAATGREFTIAGDLDIALDRTLRVDAEGVALGNARWARDPVMARARRVELDLDPWRLLVGRFVVEGLVLDHPELYLERSKSGEANWQFDRKSPRGGRLPTIRALSIRDGEFRLREPALRTDLRLDVETGKRATNEAYAPIVARGTGRYRDHPFELRGRLDSPLQLLSRGERYRLDLNANAGNTRLHLAGALRAPLDPAHFELRADASGQNLADVYALLGIATPETPPYSVRGRLIRDGSVWRFEEFEGKIGDSDMAGDVSLEMRDKRPLVQARITSQLLDLDDLGTLIGAPPSTAPGETASPEQRAEAQERSASPRLLPDKPYDLQKLRSLDADVEFRAQRFTARKLPITGLSAHVKLDDGLMRIDPVDVALAGGQITGNIELDARRDPIATKTDLRVHNLEVAKLMPRISPEGFGRIAAQARLSGRGNSVANMLATADGELGAVMGSGKMSNLVLELAGLDVAESLILLLGSKDRTVPVRCAFTDLEVQDGVATARSLALDTTDTVIVGSGTINLGDEELDLELKARPKDVSPVSLRGPLDVEGTLKHPAFRPQPARLAGRVAAAAALYAIAPPAALLALIETGPGKDLDCPAQTRAAMARGSPTGG